MLIPRDGWTLELQEFSAWIVWEISCPASLLVHIVVKQGYCFNKSAYDRKSFPSLIKPLAKAKP